MSISPVPEALRDHKDLIGPLTFSDRVQGFCSKYYIFNNPMICGISLQWIALPVIAGLGLVLLGKTAAAVLAGKALLVASGLACCYPTYERYCDLRRGSEIHAAILLGNSGGGYFWLKCVLARSAATELEKTEGNQTPLQYAEQRRDGIATAMIQHAIDRHTSH